MGGIHFPPARCLLRWAGRFRAVASDRFRSLRKFSLGLEFRLVSVRVSLFVSSPLPFVFPTRAPSALGKPRKGSSADSEIPLLSSFLY